MKKLLEWIANHKTVFALLVMALFFAPIIVVHLLFNWNSGLDFLTAEWSAGDVLAYIAGFEAFLGTVVLGLVAIYQNNNAFRLNEQALKQTEENERKSVLPFLSFNQYISKFYGTVFDYLNYNEKTQREAGKTIAGESTLSRKDILLEEIVFTIKKDNITIQDSLTRAQFNKIQKAWGTKPIPDGYTLTEPDYFYIKIRVTNCGKGAAINTQLKLYNLEKKENENADAISIPFTISSGNGFDIGIYLDFNIKFQGEYKLTIQYFDVYMNLYQQDVPLIISTDNMSADIYQPQVKVEKEKQ